MNKQEISQINFEMYYKEYNKDKTIYDDDYVDVEIRQVSDKKNEVDFLDEYIKVFGTSQKSIEVDNYIGFIVIGDTEYIGKEFLDFCIKKKLKNDKALDFYRHDLETNTEIIDLKNRLSYEEVYKTFKK